MGQSTSIIFYPLGSIRLNLDIGMEMVRILRPAMVLFVSRTRGEDRTWDIFRELVPEPEFNEQYESLPEQRDDPYDWAKLYRPGTVLTGAFEKSPLMYAIYNEIQSSFSPAISISMGNLDVSLGEHDLIDTSDDLFPNGDGNLIARPVFSIRFWGYGTPNDWRAFRDAVNNLPSVRDVKQKLEAAFGPVAQVVTFST